MRKMHPPLLSLDIIERLEAQINSLENKLVRLESVCFALNQNTDNSLPHQIKRVKQWFFAGSKAWFTFAPGCRPRRVLKKILVACKNYTLHRPWLKSMLLRHLTRLERILKRISSALIQSTSIAEITPQPFDLSNKLTPHASIIYNLLQKNEI